MKRKRRRREPAVPKFLPLEQLTPGQAFNPNRLLIAFSVRAAVLKFRKLGAGGKLLWLYLADSCYIKGYDWHSQGSMAAALGISERQIRRHLMRLVKLKLVHVHHMEGKQNRTWLLYHPIFASSSPIAPDISDRGERTETSGGSGHFRPTQRIDSRREDQTRGGAGSRVPTNGGSVARNGSRSPRPTSSDFNSGEVPITDRLSTLSLNLKQIPGWFSLNDSERRNRADGIYRLAAEIDHYRKYLDDPDASIGRQARHEVERRMVELDASGVLSKTNSHRRG